MELGTTLILVFVFILMEAFFSGCEIGMIGVNRFKMDQLAAEGKNSAKLILNLLKDPEKLFTTTSLGTNLAVVSSTAVFTGYMVGHFGKWGDLVSMLIISPFILFGGEIIPKIIFQNRADSIMLTLVHPLNFFCKTLSPLISFFTAISNFIRKKVFRETDPSSAPALSRELIRFITKPESETSELDDEEKEMISKIFHFGELSVEQFMVPLVQIYAISDTATIIEANKISNDSGYSRLPVFHERMFNLIGILNTFDLLNVPEDETPITDLIRPAYYVPPNKKLDDLLKELQQRGLHMAVVVDEYGGCIGIITVEDLLEQIVGEIEDEYDKPEKGYETYDEGYLIDGDTEVSTLNEELGLELPTGDYDTVAGLMICELEKIPGAGEQVTLNGFRLTVKDASKRKINTVILRKILSDQNEEETENGKPSSQTPIEKLNGNGNLLNKPEDKPAEQAPS